MEETHNRIAKIMVAMRTAPRTAFYMHVLKKMCITYDDAVGTMGVDDGLNLYIAPKFAAKITDLEILGVLIHEVHHVILKHASRKSKRNHTLWNVACDYAINLAITKDGFVLPEGALLDHKYKDMTADTIYDMLLADASKVHALPDGWDDLPVAGSGKPNEKKAASKGTGQGTESLGEYAIDMAIAASVNETRAAGHSSNISPLISKAIKEILEPKLNVEQLLKRFINSFAKVDYTFSRPSRRGTAIGLYLPSMGGRKADNIMIALDVSGSISEPQFRSQLGLVQKVIKQLSPSKIGVMQWDSAVSDYHEVNSVQQVKRIQYKGGGGTIIDPVINFFNSKQFMGMVIVTDGYFYPTTVKANKPVVWLVYDNPKFKAPYGDVVHVTLKDLTNGNYT